MLRNTSIKFVCVLMYVLSYTFCFDLAGAFELPLPPPLPQSAPSNSATPSTKAVAATASYKLSWIYKDTPVRLQVFEGPVGDSAKLAFTATTKSIADLPIGKDVTNTTIEIKAGQQKIFYLVAKNATASTFKFAVAPHSIEPNLASLGFQFHCLCNGHIYTVEPNSVWYRIVQIEASKLQEPGPVELKHIVFAVK